MLPLHLVRGAAQQEVYLTQGCALGAPLRRITYGCLAQRSHRCSALTPSPSLTFVSSLLLPYPHFRHGDHAISTLQSEVPRMIDAANSSNPSPKAKIAYRSQAALLRKVFVALWCSAVLLLGSCARMPLRTSPLQARADQPSPDEVLALMQELTEGVLRCTPQDMILKAKITLDGQTGLVSAVEGGYIPRPAAGGPDDRGYPLSRAPLQCLQEATIGKPALYFRAGTPFTVSYPFAH